MKDTVAQIKERLSIVEIVSPYVKLTRAGKSLRGLCPFHKEKTSSFHVSPERGTFHCFGCGVGGDGFSFIEKAEGVDFKGALKILAEKAGVQIEYDSSSRENRSYTERLREIMHRATEWYAGNLPGSPAETYSKQRGVQDDTLMRWRLGYAPPGWRTLLETLTTEGFSIQELKDAGLVKEADGKPGTFYDRFRGRLMFPIRDVSGRAIGFTGRILPMPPKETQEQEPAKYLNSPETELYRKSEILFGIDIAKDAIRTRDFTMLVEGQMDVLLAHQAGFANVVALSGTALSEKHLVLMKRYSDNLMLVLDADTAGLSATAKAAILALRGGLRVKAVQLPPGKDPADIITEDPKEFSRYITAAKPIVEFFLASLMQRESNPHRLLRASEEVVLPLVAAIPSPMEREHFAQITARSLGLSAEAVRASLQQVLRHPDAQKSIEKTKPSTQSVQSPRESRSVQLIAVLHVYQDTPLAQRVESEYLRITEAPQLQIDPLPESVLFQTEQFFGEDPQEHAADELLRAFEEIVIREAYQEAVARLRQAESDGNQALIENAQLACAKLSSRLATLTH
jgi:DNA primase